MGVMMNLIMLVCTYPIVLIMYVFMKLEIGDKKMHGTDAIPGIKDQNVGAGHILKAL